MNAHGPDDPREWLKRARSNLIRARQQAPGIYLEDLCFDAQQATEKAVKALLIHAKVRFPYTHDLAALLTLVERSGFVVPEPIKEASILTEYAVASRYPGVTEPVGGDEYQEAVGLAEAVLQWVEQIVPQEP